MQAAQTLALRSGHQQFTPLHVLKALLDDQDGLAANLIAACGGDPEQVRQAVERELAKLPEVEGGGAGQVYLVAGDRPPVRPSRATGREGRRHLRHRRVLLLARAGERHAGAETC